MDYKDIVSDGDKYRKNYIDGIKRRLSKNDKKFRQSSSAFNNKTETEAKKEIKVDPSKTTQSLNITDSIDDLLKIKEELMDSTKRAEDFISNTPSYIAHIEEQIAKEKARHELYMAGFQEKIDAAIARRNRVCEIINTKKSMIFS